MSRSRASAKYRWVEGNKQTAHGRGGYNLARRFGYLERAPFNPNGTSVGYFQVIGPRRVHARAYSKGNYHGDGVVSNSYAETEVESVAAAKRWVLQTNKAWVEQ